MKHRLTQLFRAVMILGAVVLSTQALAQRTVRGTILNATDNSPIVGASIQVKGTNTGAVSGPDGSFSIQVPNDQAVLVISFIGFNSQQVPVDGQNSLTIKLQESASQLNEVVVTGYTSEKKKDITGSVSVVDVKQMKAVPVGNPEQMLQGQAAGVNVITSGAPGGPSNVFIRGITSFGSTDPLVIIDGVQASLHDINPNDIASIQVLKDAGAAAIYGVRGSNGVIIVTTKSGQPGKPKFNYDGYVGTQRPLQGNVFHLLNSQELANALWIADINAGQVAANGNPFSIQYGNGPKPILPDYIDPGGKMEGDPAVDPKLYNIDYNKGPIYQIVRANKQGTDWFHECFKPALIQSHTGTLSGGSDKSTYLFSLGYFDQQGTLIATYLKRYSARVNTSFHITDHIRAGENAYMFYKSNPQISYNSENVINMIYREQPIIPVYDIMGNWAGSAGPELGNAHNPVADQVRTEGNRGYDWVITGNVWAEVDFLKYFTVRTSFGGTIDNFYYWYYTYHTYENSENNASNGFGEGAGYNSSWDWVNTLTFTKDFWQNHHLKILVGSEAINNYGRGVSGNRLNYFVDDPGLWVLSAGSPKGQTNTSYAYQNTLYSLISRLDYNYKDKYLLGGTLRRDASSVFGPEKRVGYFGAGSIAWRISQENFLKSVTWINDLKVRGSYGLLGSQSNVNPTNAYTLFGSDAGSSYYAITTDYSNITQGFYAVQIGNPKTGWESDIETNVGLDATVLNSKLDFSVEYYKKKIKGLLFPDQTNALVGGASLPFVNIGDIQNVGADVTVNYHAKVGSQFLLNVGADVTTYKSKVVNIPGGYFTAGGSRIGDFVRNEVGHPVSAFYGYKVIGYFQDASDVAKSPQQADAAPGRFKYADINGDGKITPDDRTYIGNPNPKFTYGLNINGTYRNFDFIVVFYGSYGNDVLNYVKYWTNFWASFQGNKSKDLLYNSWTPTNKNPKAPILENVATFSTNQVPNSYYIENGSFFKCKSLIIGYTVPESVIHRVKLEKLRVYLQVANLFQLTKYSGLDPELFGSAAAFGIDYGNYPNNQKNFILGVNLSF
ncbi:TonB-linked SusC/RagA family outer membrane protein [Thermoflavifilum aggregans]|uniref:TonB-linked SusC/RagA family outer membrane protein n=1 Tax=Thermoflavifilum aggregans TaxID=454188 RepID=A0A2M9CXN3_9BACT|nr:TonB-dependent receptor [Thermoflavifilum aggregans]PJJ76672.1 TonB-linked SusC/RagA family outer membrane protein [Thermoflavifilum aggregans]